MDNKSLEMLEFPKVREIIAGYTSFAISRELASAIKPSFHYETVTLKLKQSAEARKLLSIEPDFSIGAVMDIREPVKMAAIGKMLEPAVLLNIQKTLTDLRYLRNRLAKLSEELPLFWDIAGKITLFPHIEEDIKSCISPAGELMDTASDELAALRQQLRDKRSQLMERLDSIIKSEKTERFIQEPLITERDGRYVVPVKVELRKEFKGIVHDISNTGATAFIEPWSTVELGNELRELVIEEKREVERILLSLSSEVGADEVTILNNLNLIAELDLALAKAKYAEKARAFEPNIVNIAGKESEDNSIVLRLINARHPLLKGKPVPLTIEIGQDFSILVITGPNTGGKTVALKTIGLLTLMAQAGIPIPAARESCIPLFNGVFTDIGDEQSIEHTLSTFSWHMGNIVRIIGVATERSLILLDELGTSTDPAEGSALAQAILLYILSRGAMGIATTHFSDLKAFAHGTPGIQNASLDFDPVTLAPTYHLTLGVPGGSNAIATALRLGLPLEIIASARERLSKGSHEVETLLSDLNIERQKVATAHVELQREKDETENLKVELESEINRLKEEEQSLLAEARSRLIREGDELQNLIRDALIELKKNRSKEKVEQARKALADMREKLKTASWQPKHSKTSESQETTLAAGDRVWVKEMNLQGVIISPPDSNGQIEVQAGKTKLKLSVENIEKTGASETKILPSYPSRPDLLRSKTASFEFDLRGKRADEVESELDTYLNDACLANLSEVRIIHGIGTGVVRQIVRSILTNHPLVKSFRQGERNEGGDGATVVKLKD